MLGLTSVTFRKKSSAEIISLAQQAGLGCIEWGGDVHVPVEDAPNAQHVNRETGEAGLCISSYGSYYRLLSNADFEPILQAALALGAPLIRIWAGKTAPDVAPDSVYQQAALELRRICETAAAYNIAIAFEYHRGTLTQTAESTLRLLRMADCANLFSYWQPNPELSPEENSSELQKVLPYLAKLHVFHWDADGNRLPLKSGEAQWKQYIQIASQRADMDYLLEFVQQDSEEAFFEDAKTLIEWAK